MKLWVLLVFLGWWLLVCLGISLSCQVLPTTLQTRVDIANRSDLFDLGGGEDQLAPGVVPRARAHRTVPGVLALYPLYVSVAGESVVHVVALAAGWAGIWRAYEGSDGWEAALIVVFDRG